MATPTTFIIYNTAGTAVSAIQPNTLDGPGGVQQNSDLRMYGLGFPNWGEGVDENDYHLTENFACPSLSAFPLSVRYLALGPVVAARTPAGQATDELGAGNGVNTPLIGQLWYNTTLQAMYVNTPSGFVPTAGVAVYLNSPPTVTGTLYYPGSQLEIYNGSAFVSVAAAYLPLAGGIMTGTISMSGTKITSLGTPTAALDATTKQYVDAAVAGAGAGIFVPVAGGTMSGALNMTSAGININGGPGLTVNSGANVTINSTGSLTFAARAGTITSVNANGGKITNIASATTATDAVNTTYGNTQWLNKTSGGTVAGPTTFSSTVNVITPTLLTQAASKGYVDTAVLGTSSLTANGWEELPSGRIKIWGTASVPASGGVTVNFLSTSGKNFPHACFGVHVTIVQPSGSGSGLGVPFVWGVSTSGFSSDNTSGAIATTIFWEATGW